MNDRHHFLQDLCLKFATPVKTTCLADSTVLELHTFVPYQGTGDLEEVTLVQIGFGQTLSWTAYETSQCVRRLTQYPQEGRRQDFWTISDDPIGTRGRAP